MTELTKFQKLTNKIKFYIKKPLTILILKISMLIIPTSISLFAIVYLFIIANNQTNTQTHDKVINIDAPITNIAESVQENGLNKITITNITFILNNKIESVSIKTATLVKTTYMGAIQSSETSQYLANSTVPEMENDINSHVAYAKYKESNNTEQHIVISFNRDTSNEIKNFTAFVPDK